MGVDIAVYRARIGSFNHIKVKSRVHFDRNASAFALPSVFWPIFKLTLLLFLPVVVLSSAVVVFFCMSISICKIGLQLIKFSASSRSFNKDYLFALGFLSVLVQLLLLLSGNVHPNSGPPSLRSQISFSRGYI